MASAKDRRANGTVAEKRSNRSDMDHFVSLRQHSIILERKPAMEISEVKKGTFLTYTPKSSTIPLYLVVKRVTVTKNDTIKIFTSMTHVCNPKGEYCLTNSFKAPYEFSPNEIERTLKLTDQVTIDKINKAFEKRGKKIAYCE